MSNRKISDLSALTSPADSDIFPIVDLSEPSTANQNKKITYSNMVKGMVVQTATSGTTYNFSASDDTRIVKFDNASGITATIPAGLSSTFSCMLIQMGAGQVTVSGASGVTIVSPVSADKTAYQYAAATLLAVDSDVFLFTGDVTS